MTKYIFPLMLLIILVSPILRTSNGETFSQLNFQTLETLSSQSSKILADFQGEDKMDTQRNESSPRTLIRKELDSNRINNLKINDETDIGDVSKSYSEIEKKALRLPQKSSRAFLMFRHLQMYLHSVRFCRLCYMPSTALMVGDREISQHLKVDRSTIGEVIKLSSLVT
ncbi:uncharacterized protein METZ01_LOCUS342110, partial [marine metagenome]